jgi:DNA-binding GntR family transcriptional regulator
VGERGLAGRGWGGMGEEEKETAKKNVGVVFKNIFHALNLTSSPQIRHITFIRYSNDVYIQDAATVLPTKLWLQSRKKEHNSCDLE